MRECLCERVLTDYTCLRSIRGSEIELFLYKEIHEIGIEQNEQQCYLEQDSLRQNYTADKPVQIALQPCAHLVTASYRIVLLRPWLVASSGFASIAD